MVFTGLFDSLQKKQTQPKETKKQESRQTKRAADKKLSKEASKQTRGRKRARSEQGSKNDLSKRSRPRNPRKQPPSREALALSQQLQELSRQKRLKQALELYWRRDNEKIRDGHHACILVDCCARCGSVEEAERIVKKLEKVNVETHTALLKGYAHAGQMHRALDLFRRMMNSAEKPNVRTLNTLLRGCLWTAATLDTTGKVAGGVVSSEEALSLYVDKVGDSGLDSSSYEYSITLLCQALHTNEAQTRIDEFQGKSEIRIKGKASVSGGDQASLETLAVVYLALARSYALLGQSDEMWTSCQRVLGAVKASRVLLMAAANADTETVSTGKRRKQEASGGKRAWKKGGESEDKSDSTRSTSNTAYRNHRLTELESEARSLIKTRSNESKFTKKDLARLLLSRMFYFSGGGTTDLEATQNTSSKKERSKNENLPERTVLVSSMLSFGLSRLGDDSLRDVPVNQISGPFVYERLGLEPKSTIKPNGNMNWDGVFPDSSKPLDIEIGAGFGNWIVQQAQDNPSRNYAAVELRADRVFQIFGRVKLLDNVCVVGAECGDFLRCRVPSSSVSTLFANHPEPPTQTYGDSSEDLQSIMKGGPEPAHMLSSRTIEAMAACLKPGGRIVIVTDNRWYARLLAATLVNVLRTQGHRLQSCNVSAKSSLSLLETFQSVHLYEGRPSQVVGHSQDGRRGGVSYFDRLWQTGAGSHSERRTRFVLMMERK